MEMRRQQAMAAHPSLSSSMHNQDGSDSKAASQLPREDDMASLSNKALPTIGGAAGNVSSSSITSGMNAPGKKNAKIIPQGMQGASHVHGASKYASGAAGGASVDESEMEGSLPPIMGVMGNNSNKMGMQQTYKYDKMADNKAAAKRKKKPKNVSGFDGKHSYSSIPSYGGQQGGVSKTYGGPGVGANLSVASGAGQAQNKSSNHFNFSSNTGGHQQAKSTSLVGQGHPQGHAAHAQDKRFGKNSKGGGVSVGWAR